MTRTTVAARALLRIREEMEVRDITQRDLAERFGDSQSRIAKILNQGVNLRVEDLERLCETVGISVAEAVRDRGYEFYAELTPIEVRLLERLRRRPELVHALLALLDLPATPPSKTPPSLRVPRR